MFDLELLRIAAPGATAKLVWFRGMNVKRIDPTETYYSNT
jgi:hypothetical protein